MYHIKNKKHTPETGTVELTSGSWIGHSSMDSSLEGTHTFLLLNNCGTSKDMSQPTTFMCKTVMERHNHVQPLGPGTVMVFHLFLPFLFTQLDSLLLPSATHLLRIQCFVLIALHSVVVLPRAGHCVWIHKQQGSSKYIYSYIHSTHTHLGLILCKHEDYGGELGSGGHALLCYVQVPSKTSSLDFKMQALINLN